MRPDQHKKKKNSEYKKKHGISSEKGKKHDKKGPTDSHRSGETPHTSDEPNAGLQPECADGEDQSSSPEREHFSRRKIESNWDRYKDDDFELEDESNSSSSIRNDPIGANFQDLLDKTTIASSHFQFESEKEWQNIDTNKGNGKAGTSLLSIDCHALAHLLRNIPLAQRLDIDEKYSIGEVYDGSNTNKSPLNKPLVNHQIKIKNPTNNNSGKLGETAQNTMNFAPSSKPSISIDGINGYDKGNKQGTADDNEKAEKTTSGVKSVVEDDLDVLLGSDKNKELNVLEDNILSTHASGNQNEVNAAAMTQKPQSTADTKEDLEDWLDSILE